MFGSYQIDRKAGVELRCPIRPADVGIRLFSGWGPKA